MAKLTKQEINFLREMEVPLEKTFDATGYSTAYYKSVMRRLDLWVAYGVTPCSAYGHQLRTRAGHCLQCNTAGISYLKRHSQSQYVYLAYSKSSNWIKIGTTADLSQRSISINMQQYGGVSDWVILSSAYVHKAGEVESLIHSELSEFAELSFTNRGGEYQNTREIFSCNKKFALKVFKKIVS